MLNWEESKSRKRLKDGQKQEREGSGAGMKKEKTDSHGNREPKGQEVVGKDGDSEFLMANIRSGQFSSVAQLCSTL